MKNYLTHLIVLVNLSTVIAQTSACYNSDFSTGDFTNWTGYTSVYPDTVPGCNINLPYYYNQGIAPGRHTLITTATPDPFTNNNVLTLPPGEKYAVRLGNGGFGAWGDGVKWQRDYLEYTVTVTSASNLLMYKYAVVLQDPNKDPNVPPHPHELRPRFIMSIKDANGNNIDKSCGNHEVFVDSVMDGFRECKETEYKALGAQTLNGGSTMYRAWTTVGVDLRNYIGSNVTVRFETWDCGLGGHFGYAYLMARCDSLSLQAEVCNANGSVTVTAPAGFAYDWQPNHQSTQTVTLGGLNDGDTVRVLLTSTMGCQTETFSIVHPAVTKAIFSASPTVICVKDTVQFKEQSYSHYAGKSTVIPIVKWDWNFGDGNTSTQKNPEHQFLTAGEYTITLLVTNQNGCIDTISSIVNVMPPPVADFVATNACEGVPINYVDASNTSYGILTDWKWDMGDGNSSQLQSPLSHSYNNPGTKHIKLTITNSLGCSHDTTHSILIYTKPIPDFTSANVCLKDTTFYTDQSQPGAAGDQVTGWNWNFGDNYPIATGKNQYHTYLTADSFHVTLTILSDKGCANTITKKVKVYPLPIADFSIQKNCLGYPVKFTDKSSSSSPVNNWDWNFGDGSPVENTSTPEHTYMADGVYNITLDIKNIFGCASETKKQITIHPLPTVNFNSDKYEGCVPLCINFIDLSVSGNDPIKQFTWDVGDNNKAYDQNPYYCYNTAGNYDVALEIITTAGCKQSFNWINMIHAYASPESDFSASPDQTSESDPNIQFTDQSNESVKWWWTFGDGSVSTIENPEHTYDTHGTYPIWQFIENIHGCRDSSYKEVKIDPEWSLFVPNSFTPNGDGKNDVFIPSVFNITKFEMWIYDRWGAQIYYSNNLNEPWNGKVEGGNSDQVSQIDTYVWHIKFKDIFDKEHRKTGHVNLIR